MRLPMFPLGNVTLPGELVPLRVFEPRYRRLVLDCLAGDTAVFGIVLIERGSEVGGGDQRSSIATAAAIRTVAPLGRGQFNLVAAGARRLTVLEWLPDDPYPLADVEDWSDSPPDSDNAHADVVRSIAVLADRVHDVRALAALVSQTPSPRADQRLEVSDDVVVAGYQLAAASPLGPADRFRILQAPSVESRLEILGDALDDVEAVLRFRLGGDREADGSSPAE